MKTKKTEKSETKPTVKGIKLAWSRRRVPLPELRAAIRCKNGAGADAITAADLITVKELLADEAVQKMFAIQEQMGYAKFRQAVRLVDELKK